MDIEKFAVEKCREVGRELREYSYNKKTHIVTIFSEPTKREIEERKYPILMFFKIGAIHHIEFKVNLK